MDGSFLVGTLIGTAAAVGYTYQRYSKNQKDANAKMFLEETAMVNHILKTKSLTGCMIDNDNLKEIKEIGSSLSTYCHNNNIENLIFIDSSARFANVAFREMWKQKYGTEKKPNIYFTNPDAYQIEEYIKPFELADKFDETYKILANNKSSSIMLVDTCIHSGNTIEPILEVLSTAGYSNVSVGVMQPPDYEENGFEINLVCLDHQAKGQCHPFGTHSYLSRSQNSMLSNVSQTDRKKAVKIRKYIKESLK